MIFTNIPYNLDKNLGQAYNDFMSLLGEDDWGVFLDHDAMFVQRDYYRILTEATNSQYGLLTAMTNRIGCRYQVHNIKKTNDMKVHFEYGKKVSEKKEPIEDITFRSPFSGVVIMISKKTWNKVKFKDGFLGVDNHIHRDVRDAGIRVGMIRQLYVYHWYRQDGKGHL